MRFAALILVAGLMAACSPPAATTTEAETTTSAAAVAVSDVVVDAPAANARVTSPLVVTGTAPSRWIFEAVFPARLEAVDGTVLAEGPARSSDDWTNGNPTHPFSAELTFSVTQDTPAFLVLQEDMPGEGETPEEVRIPLVLAPR